MPANAIISWGCLCLLFVGGVWIQSIRILAFAGCLAILMAVPFVVSRFPPYSFPWIIPAFALLTGGLSVPIIGDQAAVFLAMPALGLAASFLVLSGTGLGAGRPFTAGLIVTLTATAATMWATAEWAIDRLVGSSLIESNDHVMLLLVLSAASGVIVAVLAAWVLTEVASDRPSHPDPPASKEIPESRAVLADRLPIDESSQRWLIWTMLGGLVVMFALGVVLREFGTVSNALIGIGIPVIVWYVRQYYDLPVDTGIFLWIVLAVFLHAIGSFRLYDHTFWWHNVTHTVTATLVGAIGFLTIRIWEHRSASVTVPSSLMPFLVVVFVVTVGVAWEIGEFAYDTALEIIGFEALAVAQHSLADTITDLVFNALGAIVVAVWGLKYLVTITEAAIERSR